MARKSTSAKPEPTEDRIERLEDSVSYALGEIDALPNLLDVKFIEQFELGLGSTRFSPSAMPLASPVGPSIAAAAIVTWLQFLDEAGKIKKKLAALKKAVAPPKQPMTGDGDVINPIKLNPETIARLKAVEEIDKIKDALDKAQARFEDLDLEGATDALTELKKAFRENKKIKAQARKLKLGQIWVSVLIELQDMIDFLKKLLS